MPVTSKTPEQRSSAAAIKEHRARDAAQAMREIEAKRVAVLAKTARLRAARLAKEAESADAAPKTKGSPKQAR